VERMRAPNEEGTGDSAGANSSGATAGADSTAGDAGDEKPDSGRDSGPDSGRDSGLDSGRVLRTKAGAGDVPTEGTILDNDLTFDSDVGLGVLRSKDGSPVNIRDILRVGAASAK